MLGGVKPLGPVALEEVLFEWGLHECEGRISPEIPPEFRRELAGPDRHYHAIRILVRARSNVIAAVLAAAPVECHHVEVSTVDLLNLRVMGGEALTTYATETGRAEDDSGEWVRKLTARPENVEGPLLAVARRVEGPWTLLDGLHRAAAWVAHVRSGRPYPVRMNVVLTRLPARPFE
jgi:hypothetical protein